MDDTTLVDNLALLDRLSDRLGVNRQYLASLVGRSLTRLTDELKEPLPFTTGGYRLKRLEDAINTLVERGVENKEGLLTILHNGRVPVDTGDPDIDSVSLVAYVCISGLDKSVKEVTIAALDEYHDTYGIDSDSRRVVV